MPLKPGVNEKNAEVRAKELFLFCRICGICGYFLLDPLNRFGNNEQQGGISD